MSGAGPFVLNLCSSSTPMALAQMELPELKRFTFFVSRRFEEGRERFRLHMGYFVTLAEAEEWLSVVREIYPGAWAGEAPGRKLRERATAAAAAQAQHAAGPQPPHPSILARTAGASITPPSARVMPAAPTPAPPMRVPVVHAAPPIAPPAAPPRLAAPPGRPLVRHVGAPAPAANPARPPSPALAAAPRALVKPPTAVQVPAPVKASAPLKASIALKTPAAPARAPAPVARATHAISPPQRNTSAPVPRAAPPAARPAAKPVFEDSNVREVLKALGDSGATGETRQMQAVPPPVPPVRASAGNSLSDTQVLKLLESRRSGDSQPMPSEITEGNIPLLKPDDTGTRRALKEAVANNAPVAFAVQLQWSVQPADLDNVPPLAIFSAYTLYTVEGSRDGRKWYGLRLGFFSDAISAKQVAHYVRSEFGSVAVVPVSPQEKSRATDQEIAAATFVAPVATRSDPMDEFKLIDENAARAPLAVAAAKLAAKPMPKVAVGRMVRQPAERGGRTRGSGKAGGRGQHTLEETLEILGASQLSIDNGSGETLNDSGVRHLRVEVQKNSPFSRLLERLSERLKKP